jgi:adenine-specific DNA-methyltransferase
MGKAYEQSTKTTDFVDAHEKLIPELHRVTAEGGSICWQVGYHASNGKLTPLDFLAYQVFAKLPDLHLRNRIIWTFGHGLHGNKRFSGRHEVVLWFTKGDKFKFELDRVRIPQKYPGKRHYKGDRKGLPSSNPKGKNPGDVWEIPVVNAGHVEKTSHPCQFPHALAQRLILALSDPGDVVLDPFVGSGTTAAAALTEGRRFVGSELDGNYHKLAFDRAKTAAKGELKYRPHDKALMIPDPNSSVARKP